jgi:hypothetical protein
MGGCVPALFKSLLNAMHNCWFVELAMEPGAYTRNRRLSNAGFFSQAGG